MLNLSLWFHAGRARTPGRPNHTELITLLLIQGVSEFDWGAAGPAAAQSSQCSSCQANHTSSRSFRGMSIPNKKSSISALSNSSRCQETSRPGIYTFTSGSVKTEMQKNLGVFCGFYSKGCTEVCRARPVRKHLAAGIPASWDQFYYGSLGVCERSFGVCISNAAHQAPGARTPESYPQLINRFFYIREFGSLKVLDKNRDP